MASKIVAAATARKPTFLGIVVSTFRLTETGCVIVNSGPGRGGGIISLRDEDGSLRDFSNSAPGDCLAALLAAVADEGWQVA